MNKEKLETVVTTPHVSPYRLAKIESQLRGKTIPPQKLYGYVAAGRIASSTNDLGKIQIVREEALRYLGTQVS